MVDLSICSFQSMLMMELLQLTHHHSMCTLSAFLTVNDLGPICLFLGVTVKYDHERGSLSLSQTPFINKLLDLHHLLTAQSQDVPLKSRNFIDSEVPLTALSGYLDQQVLTCAFQQIVGLLLYLATWTKPDLSYTVVTLAQFNEGLSPCCQRGPAVSQGSLGLGSHLQ